MTGWTDGSFDINGSSLVKRLISQRRTLIQPGLSFLDNSGQFSVESLSMENLKNISRMFEVSCIINVENWSRWLLASPLVYSEYGSFVPSKV